MIISINHVPARNVLLRRTFSGHQPIGGMSKGLRHRLMKAVVFVPTVVKLRNRNP
jgi:hypothetical protein